MTRKMGLYARRKLEYQCAQVESLSDVKYARYFEQLKVLNDLENDYYLHSVELPVTLETWPNKYHNFLSQMVRYKYYDEELNLLLERSKHDTKNEKL